MSPTGHGNTSVLKEKSPLHEVLRAVVKHFSPMHVHKSHFWPISTEQGRYFFHCGCMPSTGAIRWGDISFRTRPRPPTEPPILTRRNRHQQPGGADVMRAEGLGGHSTAAVRAAEPESTRAPSPTRLEATAWPAGPGRGAGGRRQGLARLRDDAFSHTSATQPHWCGGRRRDRRARAGFEARDERSEALASRAAGASGARNTRGATSNNTREQMASGRAAAHGRTKQPGPTAGSDGARNTSGATSTATGKGKPTAPGTP